jgi:antitoxin HigA-1
MSTKNIKSTAVKFLEKTCGGPLTFSNLIEPIRLADEISQSEFAIKLGISKSHLCDIEKGRKAVSPARAAKFAKILKYSEEQFVSLALQYQVTKAGLNLKIDVKRAA